MTSRAPAIPLRLPAARSAAKPRASRPSLALVLPTPSRAPRTPFVICVGALLTLGLLLLLLLNTLLAQGAFAVHDLQRQTATLSDEQQQLQGVVSLAGSPVSLAAKARALGLVPIRDPAFIRTSDGKILGHPAKAKRPYVAPTLPAVAPTAPTAAGGTAPPAAAGKAATASKPGKKSAPAARPTPRRTP